MKIPDDRQFPVCISQQLNSSLIFLLILFGISLVTTLSSRADVSFQWSTSLGASGIETDVINFSNENLVCNGSYRLIVVDNEDYVKRDLSYEFASYIIKGSKTYNFLTKFSDMGLPPHQEIKGIVVDKAMNCESVPRLESSSGSVFVDHVLVDGIWITYEIIDIPLEIKRRGIESALRNNHTRYAIDLFRTSGKQDKIKVIDLSKSFFNGNEKDLAVFNLNHIETDRSAIDLYNNGLPSVGDLRNDNLVKSIHKCGYLFVERRSPKCGIENYDERPSEHCGVLEYNSQASAQYCGCAMRSGDAMKCVGGCPCVQENVCQNPHFGVKSYKTCRSPKHHPIYKLCQDRAHGIQDALVCPK
jgi:hypothetical protein